MKPSERLQKLGDEFFNHRIALLAKFRGVGAVISGEDQVRASIEANAMALAEYLDDEQERRAKFEAGVLERLVKLEAGAKPCNPDWRVHDFAGGSACVRCGLVLKPVSPPEELDPTKSLYVGDGAPRVKRYEPDAAEPEEEAKP